MNLDAKDLLTAETLEAVFNEYALEIVAAVRVRLEELRDVYEERLRTRGEEWRKEADALSERVRKAEAALRELSARFEAVPAALPGPLRSSGGSLAINLQAKGFEVIDKRASGGKLWVLGDAAQLEPVITALQSQGVKFAFAPKGGRATGGRAAWFTKSRRY